MALYRTGKASMDAQGVISGVDTKWREPLSLIRPGATMVFLTQPLTLAVINDINSNTSMTAIGNAGTSAPLGDYVILLHDSLTVDGMAQDVAETLRYYQSKETIIEDAIEFFQNFDLATLQNLVNQAQNAASSAEASKQDAEGFKNEANQIKQDTQAIKDGAIVDVNASKEQAIIEINNAKGDLNSYVDQAAASASASAGSASAAAGSQTSAAGSASAAESSQAGAESARDQAQQIANSIQPGNFMTKAANLSDIADKEVAWINVRPTGAAPLAADPVGPLDAATRGWSLSKMTDLSVNNTLQSLYDTPALPAGASAGGWLTSRLSENGVAQADSSISVALTKGSSVAVARLSAVSRVGGTVKQAILALDSDGNTSVDGESRGKVFSGRNGAFGPAVIKKADRSSADSDNVNYISQVENNTAIIYQYLVTPGGSSQQFVTRMDVTGEPIKYFSIRVDNGMYTPEGKVQIQGSDVRIKENFEQPKRGYWERVKKIGVMEFNYRGNHRKQRGYLAQQMADIDEDYVFYGGTSIDEGGSEFEILNVNDRAVMSDVICVIQEMQGYKDKIKLLEERLKTIEDMIEKMK